MNHKKFIIAAGLIVLFHTVGILGIAFGYGSDIAQLTPWNLLLTLVLALWNHGSSRGWLTMVLVYVVGLGVEVLGVNTGFPFGQYTYGKTLGPQLWNTPWLIGVNWLILVYGANAVAERIAITRPVRAIAAASLMVMLDVLIEPAAIALGYWSWAEGTPPWENYVGWYGTSLFLSAFWQWRKIDLPKAMGELILLVEFVFFGVLVFLYHWTN